VEISLFRKVSIVGLGSISTLLILLMLEVLLASIITDTILGFINDNLMLLVIILSLMLLTIVIAFIIGFLISKDIALKSVRNASILSLVCLLSFLFVACNVTLFFNYRYIYSGLIGFEIIPVFPQVIVYFSIYMLGDVFNLFILIIIVYYVFFIFFLERFYKKRVLRGKNYK